MTDKHNSNKYEEKTIKCNSCNEEHTIRDLDAIQTHFYVSPHGCTGGDYWNKGDIHFICPEKKIVNKICFSQSRTDLVRIVEKDSKSKIPAEQFVMKYANKFKTIEDRHDSKSGMEFPYKCVANFNVEKNKEYYGIQIK